MKWNEYKNTIINSLNDLTIDEKILNIIKESKANNQTIFVAGNGGSAATAEHYTCDLSMGASKGKKCSNEHYLQNKDRYNVIPLVSNKSLILAIANDCGYDQIFKQQLINQAKANDILIGISGSGNSPNIIEAVNYAKENNIITIGMCGYDGGKLKELADYNIHVNLNNMEACEDVHSIVGHYIASWLRNQ